MNKKPATIAFILGLLFACLCRRADLASSSRKSELRPVPAADAVIDPVVVK